MKRWKLVLPVVTLILVLVGLMPADSLSLALGDSSSPGDLDTTFGSDGIVTTRISSGPGENAATGVAIQSDGKIVAVGYAPSTTYDFVVVRYTTSGALDATFGSSGIVTTSIGTGNDYARGVVIQPDGKIVVAGSAYGGSDLDFAVVRYTISGALDSTFGNGGIVTTPVGLENDYANSVAIQPDGKIVVAGSFNSGSDRDIAVVRYTASGMPDSTFGTNGIVTTPIGSGNDYAGGVAIQSDGTIVVAGSTDSGSDDDIALVRYTASGALDPTFGSGGIVTTNISSGDDFAGSIASQGGGKIVVAGQAHNGVDYNFALLRYTGSGALDPTFGSSGIVTTPIGLGKDYASGVAIQPDGKIVAAGRSNNGSDDDFAVARYHAGHFLCLPLVLNNDLSGL